MLKTERAAVSKAEIVDPRMGDPERNVWQMAIEMAAPLRESLSPRDEPRRRAGVVLIPVTGGQARFRARIAKH